MTELRVLWIDNTPTLLSSTVQLLRADGIYVDLAADGSTGLGLAETGSYSLIIVDANLPDIRAVAVLAALRRGHDATPIAVTVDTPSLRHRKRLVAAFSASICPRPLDTRQVSGLLHAAVTSGLYGLKYYQ